MDKTGKKPDELLAHFWDLYQNESSDAAVDFVFGTNDWMLDQSESIEDVKQKLRNLIRLIGTFYGYDELVTKGLAGCYILKSFIVRYDRQPVRFTFIFYKPNDNWVLQHFNFDSAVDEELRKAAMVGN